MNQRRVCCSHRCLMINFTWIKQFFFKLFYSGLDEVTASQCIRLLKNLARQGKTVICTIHQPSAISFALFDNVYVLAKGKCVYQGVPDAIVTYMSQASFICPKHYSPSDYIIEVCDTEDMNIVDALSNLTQNGKLTCCSTLVDESQITGSVSVVMKNAITSMILEKKRSRSGALLEKMKAFSKFMQNDYANSGMQQFLVLFRIMMIKIVRNRIVLAIQLFHHLFCGGIFGMLRALLNFQCDLISIYDKKIYFFLFSLSYRSDFFQSSWWWQQNVWSLEILHRSRVFPLLHTDHCSDFGM